MLDALIGLTLLLGGSCDISSAALGSCGCGASGSSFTICVTKSQTQTTPAKTVTKASQPVATKTTPAKPKTITPAKAKPVQNPTSCQEIWNVAASKGSCSKPKPISKPAAPKPKPVTTKTVTPKVAETVNLSDEATGYAPTPLASWAPGGFIYAGQSATVFVNVTTSVVDLELLEEPAQIRFTPIATSWQSSLGNFSGTSKSFFFTDPGNYEFRAAVIYQVDYKIGSDGWVINAGTVEVESNTVIVGVIDPPRRTLLVG